MSDYLSKSSLGRSSKPLRMESSSYSSSRSKPVKKDYRNAIHSTYALPPSAVFELQQRSLSKASDGVDGRISALICAAALAISRSSGDKHNVTSAMCVEGINGFVETVLVYNGDMFGLALRSNPELSSVVNALLDGYIDCPGKSDHINRMQKLMAIRDAAAKLSAPVQDDTFSKLGGAVSPFHALLLKASHRASYSKFALPIMSKQVVNCTAPSVDSSASAMMAYYLWGAHLLLMSVAPRHALIWALKMTAIRTTMTPTKVTSFQRKQEEALRCMVSVAVMGEVPDLHEHLDPQIHAVCTLCCQKRWSEFEQGCQSLRTDSFPLECVMSLQAMRKVYEEYLVCKMADTYSTIRLSEVATFFSIGDDEGKAEDIVVRCIEKGRVCGTIDRSTGVVTFGDPVAISGQNLFTLDDFTLLGKERIMLGWDSPQSTGEPNTIGNVFATALEQRTQYLHLMHSTMMKSVEVSTTSPYFVYLSRT